MGVMGDPGWNYTVGLTARGKPELIVFGLPPKSGHGVLANAVRRLDDIRDGAVLDGIASGFPMAFRGIPAAKANERFLVQAGHYYGRAVPVIQVVWPDHKGLFPWQHGCDPRMAATQSQVTDFRALPGKKRRTTEPGRSGDAE